MTKLTVQEVISLSALLSSLQATAPDFANIHVQIALDTAYSMIYSFGEYDTSHAMYETNIRLAQVFLTDKFFLTNSAGSGRQFHQNMILERVGEHVVQFAYPKSGSFDSGIFSEADLLVERLLTAILTEASSRATRLTTTHVFSHVRVPLPVCRHHYDALIPDGVCDEACGPPCNS